MNHEVLEIRRIDRNLESALVDFFRVVGRTGDEKFFHPHPFDETTARLIARYNGKDLYYAVIDGKRIIGYGMLRGWDEGYEVPSLGIIVHPEMRGMKLGILLMHFLHSAAVVRGARKVRLKVYSENMVAINMYKKLGYIFQDNESGQAVGIVSVP